MVCGKLKHEDEFICSLVRPMVTKYYDDCICSTVKIIGRTGYKQNHSKKKSNRQSIQQHTTLFTKTSKFSCGTFSIQNTVLFQYYTQVCFLQCKKIAWWTARGLKMFFFHYKNKVLFSFHTHNFCFQHMPKLHTTNNPIHGTQIGSMNSLGYGWKCGWKIGIPTE